MYNLLQNRLDRITVFFERGELTIDEYFSFVKLIEDNEKLFTICLN